MPISLLDWSVPIAILLCGAGFIAADVMGFGTALWGYSLCSLGIGFAMMLFQSPEIWPIKQIIEDNCILLGVILACRALNGRKGIENFLPLEIAAVMAASVMIVTSLLLFKSVRLETFFVQTCCNVILWRTTIAYLQSIRSTADRILAGTFLFLSMAMTFQCILYLSVPDTGAVVGAWRSSVWGNLVQYTGLLGSIILAFAVMISTSSDFIEKYRKHAHIDPLTNVLNRRGMEALLASPAGRRLISGSTAIVLADIDHFKGINDRFGHAFGDIVIARFGALLKSQSGAGARVIRLGGEEFAVLLSDVTLEAGLSAAEAMRRAFQSQDWPWEAQESQFSASFGVTLMKEGEEISVSMARADSLLYLAKREGRNCVVGRQNFARDTVFDLSQRGSSLGQLTPYE
ncbi:GGDEF domain-containing protein [Novosphingobium sp.]|uniref:GGDEF domain-containing protein n=1 Tax=Novosphingobium sp. TaxID=1874826 RepID=UPI0031E3BC32